MSERTNTAILGLYFWGSNALWNYLPTALLYASLNGAMFFRHLRGYLVFYVDQCIRGLFILPYTNEHFI